MNERQSQSVEEIEGLGGDDDDAGLGGYPLDTLLIRHETRTVHDVVRRIGQGSFIMNPDFQRGFIWSDEKQSRLIESVLMRIPLPVFYLAEDPEGRMIVVDGLQRLSTFSRYITNELALKLPKQRELHGNKFKDLAPKLQNRIEDCNLILYVVDAKVPERARLDIFERVNSGVPLTRQQMRNAIYMGPATVFLKDEAATEIFRQATGNSLSSETMRDREFVNRFCAFRLLDIDSYSDSDDMDGFLARSLVRMNQMSKGDLARLSAEFRTSLRNNIIVFGDQSFRKHRPGQERRGVLNASLWDVLSTGLARFPEELVAARRDSLSSRFFELMDNDSFVRSITYGPNSAKQVRNRFTVMDCTLSEVFDV